MYDWPRDWVDLIAIKLLTIGTDLKRIEEKDLRKLPLDSTVIIFIISELRFDITQEIVEMLLEQDI